MMDLMIHDFDYARWVAGEVTTVYAKSILSRRPDAGVDHGLAILTHASGAISHVEGSWAYPPPTFRTAFEIACERGLLAHDSAATAPITVYAHKQGEQWGSGCAAALQPAGSRARTRPRSRHSTMPSLTMRRCR